jgi:uncharacterized ion transporter superfamily protein YfcC
MLKKIPHTYVIVFSIVVLSAMLTWIIPGGTFERQTVSVNGIDRSVVVPGSFHYVEHKPQTWQIFSALFGAVFGMSEETIAFVIIFVPLAI